MVFAQLSANLRQGLGRLKKSKKTDDRSAAIIDPDVSIKPSPHPKVVEEIATEHTLKPSQTSDRSAPLIDASVVVKKAPMPALAEELKAKADDVVEFANRHHVRQVKEEVVAELAELADPELKPVQTDDRSAAVIDPDVSIKPSPHPKVVEEIATEHTLKPSQTSDRSAPLIEASVAVKKAPMPALAEELKAKADDVVEFANRHHLRQASQEMVAELSELPEQPTGALRPAETDDRSAPHIEPDVSVKQTVYPSVVSEITEEASAVLKPAKTDDRSNPLIEADVALKKAPMAALTEEIKGAVWVEKPSLDESLEIA